MSEPASRRARVIHHVEGFGSIVLVLGVCFLLMIYGFSSFFVGRSLSREVAMAEAGRAIRISCDSAVDEAISGFERSVNMTKESLRTPEELEAWKFGQAARQLAPGQVLTSQFVPTNSRKAGLPNGVDLHMVEVRMFKESVRQGPDIATDCAERRKKFEAVMQKWSKVPG
jgi:hypothetical protein